MGCSVKYGHVNNDILNLYSTFNFANNPRACQTSNQESRINVVQIDEWVKRDQQKIELCMTSVLDSSRWKAGQENSTSQFREQKERLEKLVQRINSVMVLEVEGNNLGVMKTI